MRNGVCQVLSRGAGGVYNITVGLAQPQCQSAKVPNAQACWQARPSRMCVSHEACVRRGRGPCARAAYLQSVSFCKHISYGSRAFRVLCAHCSVQKLRRRHVRSAKFGPVLFIKYGMCVVCFWTLEVPRERLSLLVQKSLCVRERCVLRKIVCTRTQHSRGL